MSVYTEHLEKLCKISRHIDAGKANDNEFTELQRLEAAIISASANGYYSYEQKKPLYAIAAQLHEEYRETLQLNERVRQISREINKQRRRERDADRERT